MLMKHENTQFIYNNPEAGRLDTFLATVCGTTRSQIQRFIKHGVVFINGSKAKKTGATLHKDDTVQLNFDNFVMDVKVELTEDQQALLDAVIIVKETDDYIVINKPSGVVSHPGAHVTEQDEILRTVSVAGWVLAHYPHIWGVGEYANRPGIVHRLDKETSGLMVIAKNQSMFDCLKKQFKDRLTQKTYITLVHGVIAEDNGVLDFEMKLGKEGKMVALPKVRDVSLRNVKNLQEGKEAITGFEVMRRFARYTLISAMPRTGRTHQIRVHFFAFNHPIVGDPLYFNKKNEHKREKELGRLFLHAAELSFLDQSGERQEFASGLPQNLRNFLEQLT